VTDREIDRVAQSVLEKMKLDVDHLGKGKRNASKDSSASKEMSIVRALAESREVCKLKYLTGAAPVVYGIPFYL
jgi:separase